MRPGEQYTLRTTEFEHLGLIIGSARAKWNNSLVGDEASRDAAINSIFSALELLVDTLAEQEAA
jgi:hypothetical protein